MRLLRLIGKAGFLTLALSAVGAELFRPPPVQSKASASSVRRLILITVAVTAVAMIAIAALGAIAFAFSGLYNIAADQPHFEPVAWFLKLMSSRSARFHTRPETVPNLHDSGLIQKGLTLSRVNCQPCHGAPGVPPDAIGPGINPKPPSLVKLGIDWSDEELYWITSHGLKMSGMPGFGARLSETDRWAIVAFMRRVMLLSPSDYSRMVNGGDTGQNDTDLGFQRLEKNGNATRGRELLSNYGCSTCHSVPGIGPGDAGPPLSEFAERQYIAGVLVNAPANLIAWIRDPQRYKPGTAMPNLNVPPEEAMHMTAYLYTLGNPKRLNLLKKVSSP
jgi:mono/diheme cytochrome c family protein